MTTHEMNEKLEEGECGEKFLDRYFRGRGYVVKPTPPLIHRILKVDRIITKKNGIRYLYEYKTDYVAGKNREHIAVEKISVDTTGELGWAYTSCADVLVTLVPPDEILFAWMLAIKKRVNQKQMDGYKTTDVHNKNNKTGAQWKSVCWLVPIPEYKDKFCYKVVTLGAKKTPE
jgi:hypothetical protein